VPLEDLKQVAAMALTKAVRGFDVTTGHEFLSYASPTIRGELRKHFRDHGWMIRPPRQIQELQARIAVAEAELSHQHGRSPRPAEVAEHLEEPVANVIEALANDGSFTPTSLDETIGEREFHTTRGDLLAGDSSDHDAAEARLLLDPVLRTLNPADQRILVLRFYEGLTQREIGDLLGISQMQISRRLSRILGQLRHRVGDLTPGA
jgi:RNA polymerase sigma-B factor